MESLIIHIHAHLIARSYQYDAEQSSLSGITTGRTVGLMNGTPAGPADRGPAARKMDQAVEKHGTCHSMHWRGHIRQVDPGITDRKKHVVVGEDAMGGVCISLTPEDVDETIGDDGVHSTAWL